MNTLTCTWCKTTKNEDEFYKNASSSTGRCHHCIACTKEKAAKLRSRPAYNSYDNVKKRCDIKTHDAYPYYGAKGITYDKDLFKSYKSFWNAFGHLYEQAEKDYPGEKLTIDRIDNSGNYVAGNIRFVPHYINENNRSDNYMIEWNGKNQSASMWARELGIPASRVIKRHKAGWSMFLISVIPNDAKMVAAITKQISQTRKEMKDQIEEMFNAFKK